MAKRDIRTVNMTTGQMVESDKVIKRIGDVAYRDLGVLSKVFYNNGNLLISKGLTVSPVTGLQVSVEEGIGVQGSANENFPFAMTANQILTLAAASGVARTDMIEMQVQSLAVKNDFSKAVIDPNTGAITTQSIKRDIKHVPVFQVKTGTTTATAATAGTLIGTVSIPTTVDLSTKYLLNICDGEDGEFVEVNIQGATPESTTKAEIVAKINAAIGRTIASLSGNNIVLSGDSTSITSYFELKPPTSNSALDALTIVFGLSSSGVYNYTYRGTNEWIKICEIDVGTATTTLTSEMIRDVTQKESWTTGASRVDFSLSIDKAANRNTLSLVLTGGTKTLSAEEANYAVFILTGTLTADEVLIVPAVVRAYEIINKCSGAFTVTVKTASSNGVVAIVGTSRMYFDGTGCHLSALIPLISNFHHRKDFNKVKNATARTTLVISDFMETVINGAVYYNRTAYDIDISAPTYWDDSAYATPANRAGKDFYIYACIPTIGDILDIKISANSTYPTGYTAANSRKIGGFHCLCVSAGTSVYAYINEGKDADYLDAIYYEGSTIANGDTSHWLKNFVQGDILPFSCWDLEHRPNENADVAGKVYDPKSGLWVDIYLPSWNAGLQKLLSVYGGTIADGTSSPAFHWYRFSQVFANQGQRLPRQDHFVACSLGSPQGVNISTSADPVTTGGYTATNGLRIISNIGVEDATGVVDQCGSESGTNTTTALSNAYDANDKNVGGQEFSTISRPLFGGAWNDGVNCGSRTSAWAYVGLSLAGVLSGRGFAEPK